MTSLRCHVNIALTSAPWGPASPWQRTGALRHPPRVRQGPAQEHLDLGVDAAELVVGPPGKSIVHGRGDAQENLLAVLGQ
jgi:hypothetical protein